MPVARPSEKKLPLLPPQGPWTYTWQAGVCQQICEADIFVMMLETGPETFHLWLLNVKWTPQKALQHKIDHGPTHTLEVFCVRGL
jgi:hypothetical protein